MHCAFLFRHCFGLGAEWDLRSDAAALDADWPDGKPTIQ
jgi:hypothetical protein